MKNIDIRVKKTTESLVLALLSLVEEKNINLISINEIVKKANLNRGTFYLHYENKEDFINSVLDNVLNDLILRVKKVQKIYNIKYREFNDTKPKATFYEIFNFVEENFTFFKVMLSDNGPTQFRDKLKTAIVNRIYGELSSIVNINKEKMICENIIFEYMGFSCLGLITFWINNDKPYSKEIMADELNKITILGPIKCLGIG